MNLDIQNLTMDRSEVYEYYFMKFIYNTEDWLFNDYSEMISDLGGYMEQFAPRVYSSFLNEYSEAKHERITKTLKTFVNSGDFRLNQNHMERIESQ